MFRLEFETRYRKMRYYQNSGHSLPYAFTLPVVLMLACVSKSKQALGVILYPYFAKNAYK